MMHQLRTFVFSAVLAAILVGPGCQKDESAKEATKQAEPKDEAKKTLAKDAGAVVPDKDDKAIPEPAKPAQPSAIVQLGRVLPKSTLLTTWVRSVGDIDRLVKQLGLTNELLVNLRVKLAAFLAKAEIDLQAPDALARLGIAAKGPIALAFVPHPAVAAFALIYVPTESAQDTLAKWKALKHKVAPEHVEIDDATETAGQVVYALAGPGGDEKYAHTAAAEVDGGLLVVFPTERGNSAMDTDRLLRKFVSDLMDSESPRLADAPAFETLVKGSEKGLVGAYLNVAAGREMLQGDRDLLMFFSAIAHLDGAAAWLNLDGNAAIAALRVHANSDEHALGRPRDGKIATLVPGLPIGAIHVAADAEKLMREIDKFMAMDKWTRREYTEAKEELRQFFGLPAGTEPQDLFNGELGFFMNNMSHDEVLMLGGLTLLVGIKDVKLVTSMLDALTLKLARQGFSKHVGEEGTIYKFSDDGVTVSGAIKDSRLFISGATGNLRRILTGQKGSLATGERGKMLGDVLAGTNAGAAYVDLDRLIAAIPPLLSKRERRDLELVWPFLSRLDYATLAVMQDGPLATTAAAVYIKDEDMGDLLLKLGDSGVAAGLDKYSRKAKTTEAIDQLDKLHRGATTYFTLPRVSMEGNMLPCQFPASQKPTPAANCCASQGGPDRDDDGRCDIDPSAWDTETWSALSYQLNDQHYCVYSFESTGTKSEAQFTATANCDLDCDGIMSTFQRFGQGKVSADGHECEVEGSAYYVENELE